MAQIQRDPDSAMLTDMQEHMMQHVCDVFGEDVIVIFTRTSVVTGETGIQTVTTLSQEELIKRIQGLLRRLST